MVGLEIIVKVLPEKRHEFVQTFQLFSKPERRHGACLSQNLFEDARESQRFLWIEQWNNQEILEEHVKTERFRAVLGAIEVLADLQSLKVVRYVTIEK